MGTANTWKTSSEVGPSKFLRQVDEMLPWLGSIVVSVCCRKYFLHTEDASKLLSWKGRFSGRSIYRAVSFF